VGRSRIILVRFGSALMRTLPMAASRS
jgi:hypothetical protein